MSDIDNNISGFENLDRDTFIELIHVVSEQVQDSKALLTKTEIMKYFKDLHLTKTQQDLIYDYFTKLRQDRTDLALDAKDQPEISVCQSLQDGKNEKALQNLQFSHLYLQEMQGIKACMPEEEEKLYGQLIAGSKEAVHKLSAQWLPRIYHIAEECVTVKKELADAVQEGNLAVFMALNNMAGSGQIVDFKLVLERSAKKAIEAYLHSTAEAENMDQSLLAKAALIYEAQKVLAQELQRMPAIEELEQYTKISADELEDILALSNTSDSK